MATSFPKAVEKGSIALALASYAAMLAYVIPRHEPWADEAQAWELATSLDLKRLFGTYIHYECSPGLWHALLWLLAKMHMSYSGLHWIVGLVALAAVALLSIAAPFPLALRLLLPFTFFFAFQYAVVARSYALFPVLLFALACLWKRRWERPWPVMLLIGLLANLSLHGFAIAVGLVTILAIEFYPMRKDAPAPGRRPLVPALALIALLAFAAWCIWPAPDAGWAVVVKRTQADTYGLTQMVGHSYQSHPWMHAVRLRYGVFLGLLFNFTQALGRGLAERWNLGLIAWALLLWGWAREHRLRYALPVLLLAAVSPPMYSQIYHAGLMWVLFLFLWWVSWHDDQRDGTREAGSWAEWRRTALLVCVVLCIAIQLQLAVAAVRYDVSMAYSPDRDGARTLRAYLNRGDTVDVAVPSRLHADGDSPFYAVGLEPYFPSQPISNMPFRFWFLGGDSDVRERYLRDSASRSAVIIVEETADDPRYRAEETRLESIGYQRGSAVCGQMFAMKRAPICHAFYEPQNQPRAMR